MIAEDDAPIIPAPEKSHSGICRRSLMMTSLASAITSFYASRESALLISISERETLRADSSAAIAQFSEVRVV